MNSFGRKFRMSVFGESHGEGLGVVLDGVPAGMPLSESDFMADLVRRRGGRKGTTPRKEADVPVILSGVFEGHTTGAPLAILFKNENTQSSDYKQFASIPRPGHADFASGVKFGSQNDPRGGGHFSGRITAPLVAAGVVAKKILASLDELSIQARLVSLGGVDEPGPEHSENVEDESFPSKWRELLAKAASDGDSLGAVAECVVSNLPIGLGEPFFDSVESMISHLAFSIPGVRGIEFGDGFSASAMKGSEHNDPLGSCGVPVKNGAGGVNGGLTNGAPLVFRLAFKPTSTISKEQRTFDFGRREMVSLKATGRHDTCFALRCPIIVEAVAAIVLADFLLIENRPLS